MLNTRPEAQHSVQSASPVSVGQNVNIEAAVKNIGEVPATNVVVHFYRGTTAGTLIDTQIISSINPDQTVTVTGRWTATLLGGGVSSTPITVSVNPAGEGRINEIDYNNNAISQNLVVNDLRADLLFVDDIVITRGSEAVSHAAQGETVDISVIAANGGSTTAISAAFYFYAVNEDDERTSSASP